MADQLVDFAVVDGINDGTILMRRKHGKPIEKGI